MTIVTRCGRASCDQSSCGSSRPRLHALGPDRRQRGARHRARRYPNALEAELHRLAAPPGDPEGQGVVGAYLRDRPPMFNGLAFASTLLHVVGPACAVAGGIPASEAAANTTIAGWATRSFVTPMARRVNPRPIMWACCRTVTLPEGIRGLSRGSIRSRPPCRCWGPSQPTWRTPQPAGR